MKTCVAEFLKEMVIDASLFDPNDLIDKFINQMTLGLEGKESSLQMIPSYVGVSSVVQKNEQVVVIDAGGTNLRVCLVEFDNHNNPQISNFTKVPMLGTQGILSAHEFFNDLADLVEPLMSSASTIGFCFSYPAQILPNLDAVLLRWTKEIRVPELVGKHLGQGLKDSLAIRGISGKKIVILNDTVACLLAGRSQCLKFGSEDFIGFILGTGTNTSYVEKNRNIQKISHNDLYSDQVVNVESGSFNLCKRGKLDIELDNESENPGSYTFEKMLSGVYLGALANKLIVEAQKNGLFSSNFSLPHKLSWVEINLFLLNSEGDFLASVSKDDRDVLRDLFIAIIDRTALLTAVNISAAVIKSGRGLSPEKPVCINIDGSTYHKSYTLSDKVQIHLKELLDPRGFNYICVAVDDSPLLGAAIAALTIN